jgi:acetoin utilization deacetylase AcuC-like enzyme
VRKTNFYYSEVFLDHATGQHFECPERLVVCLERLRSRDGGVPLLSPRSAGPEEIARVHDRELIEFIEGMAASGGGNPDGDTVVSPGSYKAALLAAGAAIEAAEAVACRAAEQAVALVRPPGHHARRAAAMGFCLFNNVAVAAKHLLEKSMADRLALLDFDVHHGNGTQEAFYADGRVLFVSFHRFPFYPGTGRREETGAGPGEGLIVNVPLPYNTSARRYLATWRQVLNERVRPFAPQVVLVSAGFDAHKRDPVGGLNFEVEDFRALGRSIVAMADVTCSGRVVSVLEGGYDLEALPRSLEAYLEGLETLPSQ